MRLAWPVACVCLLGVFAGALVHSLEYPLRDALGFGPGFFPFCLSVIGVGLSAVLLLQALRGKVLAGEEAGQGPSPPTLALNETASARDLTPLLKALAVLLAMVLATALLEPLGYRLTVMAFVAILLPVLGARSVPAIAIAAAAGSFGVFHVFYYWLKVPLPVGALGI